MIYMLMLVKFVLFCFFVLFCGVFNGEVDFSWLLVLGLIFVVNDCVYFWVDYVVVGFYLCGLCVVCFDMFECLVDEICEVCKMMEKGCFLLIVNIMVLMGCFVEDVCGVFLVLGYKCY